MAVPLPYIGSSMGSPSSVWGDKTVASGNPALCPLVCFPVEGSEGWETDEEDQAASVPLLVATLHQGDPLHRTPSLEPQDPGVVMAVLSLTLVRVFLQNIFIKPSSNCLVDNFSSASCWDLTDTIEMKDVVGFVSETHFRMCVARYPPAG